jgi:hypothetical protein
VGTNPPGEARKASSGSPVPEEEAVEDITEAASLFIL